MSPSHSPPLSLSLPGPAFDTTARERDERPFTLLLLSTCRLRPSLSALIRWRLAAREGSARREPMRTTRQLLLFDREGKRTAALGGVDQRKQGENLISHRSFFVASNLSDMLIQIISRREDYRLYVYSIIEWTDLIRLLLVVVRK